MDLVKKWVAALRSGEYKQGTGRLRVGDPDDNQYCCLGVLCDIVAPELWTWSPGTGWLHDLAREMPADKICEGVPRHMRPVLQNYATMNDDEQATFSQIADRIEKDARIA